MKRAEQAPGPKDSIRILQDAIPGLGGAPNLQEAYDALADSRRKADENP